MGLWKKNKKVTEKVVREPIVKNEKAKYPEVDKWQISTFVAETLYPIVGNIPYPLDELMLITSAVLLSKPTHVIEWGTHIGKSARIFYEIRKYFRLEYEILSFDLPDDVEHVEHPHEQRGMLVRGLEGVKLYQEDALVKGIELFNNNANHKKKALFYVDGDHEYDTVLKELKAIFSKIESPDLLLHDTFNQSSESNYNTGPYRAIQDFFRDNDFSTDQFQTDFGLPGMTYLKS